MRIASIFVAVALLVTGCETLVHEGPRGVFEPVNPLYQLPQEPGILGLKWPWWLPKPAIPKAGGYDPENPGPKYKNLPKEKQEKIEIERGPTRPPSLYIYPSCLKSSTDGGVSFKSFISGGVTQRYSTCS